MKVLIFAGLILSLMSCGGGGGSGGAPLGIQNVQNDDNGTFNPNGNVVNACAAPYYRALHGVYDGQITYQRPQGNACAWEVELTINADYFGFDPTYKQTCFIELTYRSSPVSGIVEGDNSLCQDLDVRNRALEPYAGPHQSSLWTDPTWPVELSMLLAAATEADLIFPTGQGPSQLGEGGINFIHDGQGNVSLERALFNPEYWDGVMMKRLFNYV